MPARKKSTPKSKASPAKSKAPQPQFWSVAVLVSNRPRSVEWYTQKLGLDVVQDFDHWVTVGRRGENGVIHLCQTSDWMDKELLEPGNQGIQLHLPGDFEASCAALQAKGVRFSQAPKHEAWGWWAMVVDPDGNEIALGPTD